METSPQYPKHEPVGPVVAIVVIVILLALGGVYFFAKQYMEERSAPEDIFPAASEGVSS